ncbi:uncharacterized protein PSFLO_07512 [Pseudozyma flocculosa]|uniref:Uncharacterized protein n=1 Tax=Pseudozyma flocculosa TaxID=84751 RepID=A0A5C3FF69_9BASI|nr:uncharacterized protein PSFLO_07512 [Pseudozyma flocculosa]
MLFSPTPARTCRLLLPFDLFSSLVLPYGYRATRLCWSREERSEKGPCRAALARGRDLGPVWQRHKGGKGAKGGSREGRADEAKADADGAFLFSPGERNVPGRRDATRHARQREAKQSKAERSKAKRSKGSAWLQPSPVPSGGSCPLSLACSACPCRIAQSEEAVGERGRMMPKRKQTDSGAEGCRTPSWLSSPHLAPRPGCRDRPTDRPNKGTTTSEGSRENILAACVPPLARRRPTVSRYRFDSIPLRPSLAHSNFGALRMSILDARSVSVILFRHSAALQQRGFETGGQGLAWPGPGLVAEGRLGIMQACPLARLPKPAKTPCLPGLAFFSFLMPPGQTDPVPVPALDLPRLPAGWPPGRRKQDDLAGLFQLERWTRASNVTLGRTYEPEGAADDNLCGYGVCARLDQPAAGGHVRLGERGSERPTLPACLLLVLPPQPGPHNEPAFLRRSARTQSKAAPRPHRRRLNDRSIQVCCRSSEERAQRGRPRQARNRRGPLAWLGAKTAPDPERAHATSPRRYGWVLDRQAGMVALDAVLACRPAWYAVGAQTLPSQPGCWRQKTGRQEGGAGGDEMRCDAMRPPEAGVRVRVR